MFFNLFLLIYHLHDIADARHFQNFPDAPVGVNHIHLASKTGNLAVTPRQYADAGAVHKFCVGKIKHDVADAVVQHHVIRPPADHAAAVVVDFFRQTDHQIVIDNFIILFHATLLFLYKFRAGTNGLGTLTLK